VLKKNKLQKTSHPFGHILGYSERPNTKPLMAVTKRYFTKNFFFNLCCGTLGTAATTGLLYQPQTIGDNDSGEKLVD
jgi:hypothetical protein